MYVVALYGWQKETAGLVQALADVIGILPFEARQRMIVGGPSVVASFADPQMAQALAISLAERGFATLVVDATAVRSRAGHFIVRRFEQGEMSLRIESGDGQRAEIPYGEIELLLTGMSTIGLVETKTVSESKFSLGKTLLSGGIPMTKKVEREETVTREESSKLLYLYAGDRPPGIFSQNGMAYDGFGAAMKLSRELNFAYLTSELRRHSPRALYDDRLLNRSVQVRLLGPAQHPESNLDLAAEILARSLLSKKHLNSEQS